ncbi:glycoside hydrolase family 5 protein [Kitasatospora sp. RB6PN24]|uniref:glycoside hydrolase family 5 protein n=1 Tax=Kitasatospora humi TaxID=2893891 RepID=UPI001E437E40|nr:glycoside hydrolase family 5 protein [Kitasatospora humi]MCC9308196.1 glycoside hydrolase family 5 protein [Kitasatospora humi]
MPLLVLVLLTALTVHLAGDDGTGGGAARSGAPVPACTPWQVATTGSAAEPRPSARQQAARSRLAGLKLLSYYPAQAPWSRMWQNWQPGRVDADFARINGLGANAVRLMVHAETFGYPDPDQARLAELRQAVSLAARHGLTVQLTLFDWWNDYTDLAGSDRWTHALLDPYRDDPRIAFVELKNEVDPGDRAAVAWVRHELPTARQAAGHLPVTVSVTGSDPVARLAALRDALTGDPPDFYDLHYYGEAGYARAVFEAAEAVVAPAPLYIGETGTATAPGDGTAQAGAEAAQDLYLRTVEWAARSAGLPAAAPWIFQDISPGDVPDGASRAPEDLDFGLLRADGSEKPAAASLRAQFTGPGIGTDFNGDLSGGQNGTPDDWTAHDASAAQAFWDPEDGHRGPGSAVLSGTSGAAGRSPSYLVEPVEQPTAAGQRVRLTAWARGVRATGRSTIAVTWFDRNGTYLGEDESPPLPAGSSGWRRLSVDSTAPACAAAAVLALKSRGNTGQARFTEVTFSVHP